MFFIFVMSILIINPILYMYIYMYTNSVNFSKEEGIVPVKLFKIKFLFFY